MVFLRSFGILSVSWTNSESVPDLKNQLSLPEVFKFYRNGKVLEDQDVFAHDDTIEIIAGGLPGGKGGFGSMLRAMGNQIQKTSNKEACRDLSGRRLRDINEVIICVLYFVVVQICRVNLVVFFFLNLNVLFFIGKTSEEICLQKSRTRTN